MKESRFDIESAEISWCPGCGNFFILEALKGTFEILRLDPVELVIVSGIGQAGKTPHYLKCNMFNGLHGRSLPLATAVKAANPRQTVIAQGGDGDMYGEGGNHLLHAIRRNPDITVIVHNNMVYGLTKGQASPTSARGFTTGLQVHGVASEPFNPLAMAISLNASFVARTFAGDREGTSRVLAAAIRHRGFALVDILQPCVTFNKVNTYQWFKDRIQPIPHFHDPSDRIKALELAFMTETLPVGVLFVNEDKLTFEEFLPVYDSSDEPLYNRGVNRVELQKVIDLLR
ncbi:MAG: thiamine pyrophosphate-dependent enzyme [bacterium]|nr:thiamine pyrophosphate-dependent enzyme [bacterium]MDT8367138.1 thiamine pyrophosphate-dependent enzyme [bacterium]